MEYFDGLMQDCGNTIVNTGVTMVTPVQTHWSDRSLAQSHRFIKWNPSWMFLVPDVIPMYT